MSKRSAQSAIKKGTKKSLTRPSVRPGSQPVKQLAGQLGGWIEQLRPAWLLLMVALAWLGQEQLWNRQLSPGFGLWLAAAIIGTLIWIKTPPKLPDDSSTPSRRWLEAGGLSLAIITAFLIRFIHITELPNGYFFDEATNALIGLRMLQDPGYLPIFGPPDAPAPTLYHYLNAVMQYFGGAEIIATKMVPVLLGTLTVPMFYFLMRRVVSWPVALAAAFVLAFMRWHINFSRINFIGIATPLFAAAAAYFLLRGLETKNRWHMGLSGLAVATGLYTYYASNLIPFVLGPYMLMQLVWEKEFVKKQWLNVLVFLLVSFAVFAPLGYFAFTHQHQFTARSGQVLIFNHVPPEQAMQALWQNIKTTWLMFNYFGDTNGRHNIPEIPMLDFTSGLLFGLGLIWTVLNSYRQHAFLMLWWLIIALVPGYLTIEAPQSYRCIGAIIPVAMITTVGLEQLWQASRRIAVEPAVRKWLWVGLVLVMAVIGLRNVTDYFTKQADHRACWSEFSAREYEIGKMINALGPNYHTYISASAYNFPTIRYLGQPHMEAEPFMMTRAIPSSYQGNKNLAYMLLPIHDGALELLQHYYPAGTMQIHRTPFEFNLFTSYLVSREELQKNRGLQAVYQDATGREVRKIEGSKQFTVNINALGLSLPIQATWSGSIAVPAYGHYEFVLQGAANARIIIDNQEMAGSALKLAQGQHQIKIMATIEQQQQPIQLFWKRGGSGLGAIMPGYACLPRSQVHGLTGTYWRGPTWQGKASLKRLDPLMSFVGADFPMAAPFSAKWEGKIDIPKTGNYTFGMLQNQHAWLMIDNELVLANEQADQYQEDDIFLKKGLHEIKIEYQKLTGAYPRLILYWTPPSESKEKVPFTALMPD